MNDDTPGSMGSAPGPDRPAGGSAPSRGEAAGPPPDAVRRVPAREPEEDEVWARRPLVRLRTPADLAEILPYLLGFQPTDSVVALGLQGPGLSQGGTLRVDLPAPRLWPAAAEGVASALLALSERRATGPAAVVLYLCQDGGAAAFERLRPLAHRLERAFEQRGVPVRETLCVSDGRWWSYRCERTPGECSCDPAGTPVTRPGTTPVAAAAAYAGIRVRGTLRELQEQLAPIGGAPEEAPRAAGLRDALDRVSGPLVDQVLAEDGPAQTRQETADLLRAALEEFRAGAEELTPARTARLVLGLQDRHARDRAAEWVEPAELGPAGRLWRYLARSCVGPFRAYAAAPLSLLGWTSWFAQDEVTARVALAAALDAAPGYTFAELLYQAVNCGADPELLRDSLRAERAGHEARGAGSPPEPAPPGEAETPSGPGPAGPPAGAGGGSEPAGVRTQAARLPRQRSAETP